MHRRALPIALFVLSSLPASLISQCVPTWDPSFGLAGAAGTLSSAYPTSIQALHVWAGDAGPALYAAGSFSSIGGVPANGIAKWDGAAWTPLGSGLNGLARTMTSWTNGGTSYLVVGGEFTLAGGVPAGGIAAWDGTSWTPLGAGMNGPVFSLASHDDGTGAALYAGGQFSVAGTTPVGNVARWNGTSWADVAGGITNPFSLANVRALISFDGGSGPALFAAASAMGGAIMRLTPAGWSMYQPAVISVPQCLAAHDDGSGTALYSGYYFSVSGTHHVRRLESGFWNPVGSVPPSPVYALDSFPTAGVRVLFGASGHSLVAWNGTAWSILGTADAALFDVVGFDDGSGPSIYVGGSFTALDSVPAMRIGRWRLPVPRISLAQPGGPGSGVFVVNDGLIAGRAYHNVFSSYLCPGTPGSGPYLGLCAPSIEPLLEQVALPLGTPPFHFSAWSASSVAGPFALPPSLVLEMVCFEGTNGVLGCISPVTRVAIP